MAELADALDSGSNGRKAVQVQVLLPAPIRVFIRTLGFFLCQSVVMNTRTIYNLSYKNSLPNRRAVFVSMPGKPEIMGFPGFFCFPGLGGIGRHQPAFYCGDHIVPWRLVSGHPCPALLYQKQGNAKKYPLPDNAPSFNDNNLTGTLRIPPLSYSRSNGSPQSPQITLTSRVARMIVPQQGQTYLILRLMDFLLPPLLVPSTGKRLAFHISLILHQT